VGCLPLALELLNAAMKLNVVTADEVRDRMTKAGSTRLLDDTMDVLRCQVPEGALRGISEALALSYDCLSDEVRAVARVLAFLGPEPIPTALVNALSPEERRGEVRSRLLNHSFVVGVTAERQSSTPLFGKMHRVVADFLRLQSGEARTELHAALRAISSEARPPSEHTSSRWNAAQALLPHTIALLNHLTDRVARDERNASPLFDLGNTYFELGDQAGENEALRVAVAGYLSALEGYTRERAPLDWATTQNNLGNALATLGAREPGTARLEEAVAAYRAALAEVTPQTAPHQCEIIRNNLQGARRLLDERRRKE
jgi:tetratricopeptide (TPR) repeat protein